ncbi:hypothetical protein ACFSHT_15980 [Paraburkholderia silviterrae]|uniref:Pectate lyase superfamily protein domain-containing protein n=1 Tax=Paraburkholderia silviterrae TaxID=2528715 RepID=A0A4R5MA67_9BURK|nr:hypothetical protein [Paraburkholderia silviterrae]TDG23210.1 hypothetical protein EYW47_14855 [Paraburkholderia silviterrae]
MKSLLRVIFFALALVAFPAFAQFTPGVVLTAAQLNNQFALYVRLAGGTLTGSLTVPGLTVTGGLTATGLVTTADLAAQAANTVLANATSSSASPAAFTMPSCSSSSSALQWTAGSGFTCGTVASAGANGNITSLTGLTTALSVAQGGMGATSQTAHAPLIGEGTGAVSSSPGAGTSGQFFQSQGASADPVWGYPTSYYNVFNSMTPTQVVDVLTCGYTQDVKSVIQTALNTYGAIFLPKGCYRTSGPIDNTAGVMVGAGAHQSFITSYDSTAADSVITAGGAAVIRDLGIGFNSSIITGSETQGQRNGIQTYSPVSSLALQRGGRIENVLISYVGTGLYNPTASADSMFSAHVMNLEVNGYSYRGLDIEGATQTGSVFSNLYVTNYNGSYLFTSSADAGAVFGQCSSTGTVSGADISELSLDQLNIEWSTVANAVRFCGVTGVSAGTVHLEEITLRTGFSGLIDWRNSSGRIGSLSVYYAPIKAAGWYVARLWDSANLTGSVSSLNNQAMLDIGVLNLHGLNDGPQVTSGNGLSGVSNFYILDRETSAVGPYVVRIGAYVWQSYQSDSSVYSSAPNDPHSMLLIIPTPSGFNYPPVASSCGTSPTVAAGSTIYSGSVTVGTSGTACTLTFAGAGFSNQARGVVVDNAGGSTPPYTVSKTSITISTATAGHTYSYSISGN